MAADPTALTVQNWSLGQFFESTDGLTQGQKFGRIRISRRSGDRTLISMTLTPITASRCTAPSMQR